MMKELQKSHQKLHQIGQHKKDYVEWNRVYFLEPKNKPAIKNGKGVFVMSKEKKHGDKKKEEKKSGKKKIDQKEKQDKKKRKLKKQDKKHEQGSVKMKAKSGQKVKICKSCSAFDKRELEELEKNSKVNLKFGCVHHCGKHGYGAMVQDKFVKASSFQRFLDKL